MADVFGFVSSFIGAIVGGIITVLIGPWVAEKFKLREQYFVPFQKWCTEFYGDLYEFYYRYIKDNDKRDFSESRFSDILIILDYRSLHDSLISSPQWLGKIQKENENAGQYLTELLETVDKFWHRLENDYPLRLPSVEGVKAFNAHIKSRTPEERKEIADRIRSHLKSDYEWKTYNEKTPLILRYLIGRVPSSRWVRKDRGLKENK